MYRFSSSTALGTRLPLCQVRDELEIFLTHHTCTCFTTHDQPAICTPMLNILLAFASFALILSYKSGSPSDFESFTQSAELEALNSETGRSQSLASSLDTAFHDKELGVSLHYPSEWTVDPRPPLPTEMGSTTFFGPRVEVPADPTRVWSPKVTFGALSGPLPPGMTLIRYSELIQCLAETASGETDARLFSDQLATPAGADGTLYIVGTGFQYLNVQRGSIVWRIAANFGPSSDEKLQSTFLEMVRSLSFENASPTSLDEIYGPRNHDSSIPLDLDETSCRGLR